MPTAWAEESALGRLQVGSGDLQWKQERIPPQGGQAMALEGQKAPAFELAGSDGKKYSVKECMGRRTVIFFYPKDSTSG
jgi:peroxiredoxin